jgi:hypothetical protein
VRSRASQAPGHAEFDELLRERFLAPVDKRRLVFACQTSFSIISVAATARRFVTARLRIAS